MNESNILEARLARSLEGTERDRVKLLRALVDLAESGPRVTRRAWGIFKDHKGRPTLYGVWLPRRKYKLLDGWYWSEVVITYDDAPIGRGGR